MSIGIYAPEIRFKGFYGEWVEKQLSEIGSLKNGMNFDKTAMGHGHPFVNLQDVFGKNEVSDKHLGFAFSTEQQRKDYSLNEGDVLFIRSSVKPEGVGEAAVISKNMDDTTYSGFMIRFRPDIEMDVNFSRFIYSTAKIRKQILASSTSSANSNINQESLQRIKLSLPYEPEQAQIGNTFQKLDTLINQHQQKHGKLSNLKKAMLEKMFPKQGETIPEIRFKKFCGEWVESSVAEEAIITTGFPFDSADFSESSDLLVITNSNIQNNSSTVDGKVGNRIASKKVTLLNQYRLNSGDILVTMDGSVGRTAKVVESNQILAQRVGRLVARKDTEFLYQSLNTGRFLESMTTISHGGTIKHISLSEIGSYLLQIPKDIEEQVKIGEYFKKLDNLITQHQQQITKLKNIKQACLSKMFV